MIGAKLRDQRNSRSAGHFQSTNQCLAYPPFKSAANHTQRVVCLCHQYSNKAVDKRTRNDLYMRLDLVGNELDQVELMWGQTRYGVKSAATLYMYRKNISGYRILISHENSFQAKGTHIMYQSIPKLPMPPTPPPGKPRGI